MSDFYKETKTSHIYCKDTIQRTQGLKNLRSFFYNLLENFDEEASTFYKFWGHFPFIYSEKQLASILAPSIHKHTKNVWFEQPFKDYKKNQRFLDLAIADNENIYLIELKHSWNSKTNITDKQCSIKWEIAIEQIKDINRRTIYRHFNFEEFNVFKIALMVMPTYIAFEEEHDILSQTVEEYTNNLFKEFDSYTTQKHRANFTGVIKLKNPKKFKHEYKDGNQIYPYISFLARVEEI
jgi:hypothetical protein